MTKAKPLMSARRPFAVARQKDRRWRSVHCSYLAAYAAAQRLANRLGEEFLVYKWSDVDESANYCAAVKPQVKDATK